MTNIRIESPDGDLYVGRFEQQNMVKLVCQRAGCGEDFRRARDANVLNGVSMAVGVMEMVLYSSYALWRRTH